MTELKRPEEALNKNIPGSLKLCFKLAELEKHWQEVVGSAAAERSAPVSCDFSEEGPIICIHVDSPGVLPALRSRKPVISKSICRFLGLSDVRIDLKVGKVRRPSLAKEPLPDHLRRPPVLISENCLQKNIEEIGPEVNDDELTESLAKLKSVIEKRNLRKR